MNPFSNNKAPPICTDIVNQARFAELLLSKISSAGITPNYSQ